MTTTPKNMQNSQKPELEGLQGREPPKKNTTTYPRLTRILVSSCTKATKSAGRTTIVETNLEAEVSYFGPTRTWARVFTIPSGWRTERRHSPSSREALEANFRPMGLLEGCSESLPIATSLNQPQQMDLTK